MTITATHQSFAWRLLDIDHALLPSEQPPPPPPPLPTDNDNDNDNDTDTDSHHHHNLDQSAAHFILTDDHVLQLHSVFLRQDSDRDGQLTSDELKTCLSELGFPTKETFLRKFCLHPAQVKIRGLTVLSFKVDFATFVKIITKELPLLKRTHADLVALFGFMDEKQSGRISRQDLRHLLVGVDVPSKLNHDQFLRFCSELDFDRKNTVNILELTKQLLLVSPADWKS
jgi:Ca2+-binding EF-hand superfamily protein